MHLEDEQYELLAKFVEAHRSVPKESRGSFVSTQPHGHPQATFFHSLVSDLRFQGSMSDAKILAQFDLLGRSYSSSASGAFSVLPRGIEVYEQWKISTPSLDTASDEQAPNLQEAPSNLRIFISHAARDESLAEAFVECLLGCMVLDDKDVRCTSVVGHKLPIGSETATTLRDELGESSVVVGLLTKNSISSAWVIFELGATWGAGKNLVPVLADDLDFKDLPGPLSGHHAVKIVDKSGLIQASEEIAKIIGARLRSNAKSNAAVDKLVEFGLQYAETQASQAPDKEGTQSKLEISAAQARLINDLATLDEPLSIRGTYKGGSWSQQKEWETSTTWRELFCAVSPLLLESPPESAVFSRLALEIADIPDDGNSPIIDSRDRETIRIQFLALDFIRVSDTVGAGLLWTLTSEGYTVMLATRSIKTSRT